MIKIILYFKTYIYHFLHVLYQYLMEQRIFLDPVIQELGLIHHDLFHRVVEYQHDDRDL